MPDFKEIAKGGWHPKGKAGKGESWRGDFKGVGQVAGCESLQHASFAEHGARLIVGQGLEKGKTLRRTPRNTSHGPSLR